MAIQSLVAGRIFYLLSISQLIPSLLARSSGGTGAKGGTGAPALAAGIVGAVILQIIFSHSSFINSIFSTAPLTLDQWLLCLAVGLPMIAIAAFVNRFDPPN
jgi:Ca2+-transporting ATPase